MNDLAKILGIDINQLKKLCNAFKKSGLKINPLQHLTKNIYLFKHHSILVVDNLTKIWLQACTTNETSVDVCLCKELYCICCTN